jgi:hypothetical protein
MVTDHPDPTLAESEAVREQLRRVRTARGVVLVDSDDPNSDDAIRAAVEK